MSFLSRNFNSITFSSYFMYFSIIVSSAIGDTIQNEAAVKNYRDYLKINTAHPDPDYDSAAIWIEQQARDLGLKYNFLRFPNGSKAGFAIWLTWEGLDDSLPTLLLYSHIDVVPVDPEWQRNPFTAEMDAEGNIYGRGAQDMKSAAVQYLEAIRNLKLKGVTPNRTVHIGFLPDEEIGGHVGIRLFVSTPEFINMNVGFVLDEGLPKSPTDPPNEFTVYNSQRTLAWANFTALGESGHGSLLLNNTAAEKILRVINKLMNMREVEKFRLESNTSLHLGEVTSVNLNILEGGLEANIIPPRFSAIFDLRITPDKTYTEIMKFLQDTCTEAGPNVTFELIHTTLNPDHENALVTKLEEDSWWWSNFQKAFDSMNLTLVPRVFPAGTDGEVTRRLGIPTLGFSPIYDTPMLFHARDEFLNVEVFLKGIEIYETLIENLVYVPPPPPEPTTIKPDHDHGLGLPGKGNGTGTGTDTTKKPSKGKSSAPTLSSSSGFVFICICLFSTIVINS